MLWTGQGAKWKQAKNRFLASVRMTRSAYSKGLFKGAEKALRLREGLKGGRL
jgi:hypothetical protein